MTGSKTAGGRFFEDFVIGEAIAHATPRTVDDGDAALYRALYGSRFALTSSAEFAQGLGLRGRPIDELLAFHIVFGKTVPDVSLNAVANLGYAQCRFLAPVYPGDTLRATSSVVGLRATSNGRSGVVYVNTIGRNQSGTAVLDYIRWVLVPKRDPGAPSPDPVVPATSDAVRPDQLVVPTGLSGAAYDTAAAGAPHLWDDYSVGERIDHVDGVTVEEAEHMLATRLYQNTARVHFNGLAAREGQFGRRLVYGGHVISIARALSFNGLANAVVVAAINGGSHTAPLFAGDTVFAWSEVLALDSLGARTDLGALRLRTVALKDRPAADFPDRDADGRRDPAVLLELDYWVLMPRR